MAINISSGPRPTPSLASLNFDGAVDNRRKNLEVVKQAQDERREFDRETNAKIQDDFEKSKIIHGQILAATQQNPDIVNQLQASVESGSNDATTKAYKRFIDGTHTQSDLAVINAYITAATTQQETQRIQDQRDLEAKIAAAQREGTIAAASFAGTVYTGKTQEEIDAITSGQYLQESFDYAAQNNITGNALDAFHAANTKFSQSIDNSDQTADIRNFNFSYAQRLKLRDFVDAGDYQSARLMMDNLKISSTYSPFAGAAEVPYDNEYLITRFGSQANPDISGKKPEPKLDPDPEPEPEPAPQLVEPIAYEYKGREIATVRLYNSGNTKMETRISGTAKNRVVKKVTQSKFETYTRKDQRKYLEKYGEEFEEETGEPTLPASQNSNILDIKIKK